MVKLGSTDAPAPFEVQCPVAGTGRWSDTHTWTYMLNRPLNPGERCKFVMVSGLKALDGSDVSGERKYTITTPGPWVLDIQPFKGARIEEDQVFLITPRFPVKLESVAKYIWCQTEGVGERISVRLLPEAELTQILNGLNRYHPPSLLGVQCSRPLPPGAKMELVWGKGIEPDVETSAQNDGALSSLAKWADDLVGVGTATTTDEVFAYQVRIPFRAELTCERERPNAPCSPMSDLWLQFSDRVGLDLAGQIRLVGKHGKQKPWDYSAERKAALAKLGQKVLATKVEPGREDNVDKVVFKGPFPPNSDYHIVLPEEFHDLSGRSLSNAASFPLKTRVGGLPPLAKFAADFGILELKEDGILPVTLRNTESKLKLRVLRQTDDAEMIKTWAALEKFELQTKPVSAPIKNKMPHRTLEGNEYTDQVQAGEVNVSRELSYLKGRREATVQDLPKPGGAQSFEVIGIPLQKPGFYVVEIESTALGARFFKEKKPMYVRSTALVTDLAVHFKMGRDNGLAWVTSLSTGKPVGDAEIKLYDCAGKVQWNSKTDERGIAFLNSDSIQSYCFVTARKGEDFSFVRSDWTKGIEPWRYNVNSWNTIVSPKIHTILDRTLLRAGETVSMKHIARIPHVRGFSYPQRGQLPSTVTILLSGGDTKVTLPLVWDARGVATTEWRVPETAKLGSYSVLMDDNWHATAEFRVSEFRLPKYKGAVVPSMPRFANVSKVPLRLSLEYLNGGSASGQQVQVSGLLSSSYVHFPQYGEFNFMRYRDYDGDEYHRLVADKLDLKLDRNGGARVALPVTGEADVPTHLLAEMTFTDPSGEVQTIGGEAEIWPASIIVGARVKDWASLHGKHQIEVVALDTAGKPRANVPITISGERRWALVHRKRILGGFYSYESERQTEDLGVICKGKTDSLGLFECETKVRDSGEVRLHVVGTDSQNHRSETDTGYWSSADGDFWFEQEDLDRMDVVPEKREYEPGEMARFQVRTPFREATALITVEREGIVESFVRPLTRQDAIVEIPVGYDWGPNVYVSVLLVRGREDVPQATAMVDLARPAFKLGLTRIEVGRKGARLLVDLSTDKPKYAPRSTAKVKIQVRLPNGKPAPQGSEVAIAAVDRALLELSPNPTWDLLDDMMQERAYMVKTATAQMQVVGKRHFGKKALPAGGGGGKLSARELFDTLLYWNPRVKLDAGGAANVEVPLNDSLTAFKVVAVADVDAGLFGTGETELISTQDLQITSALPPMVREGDSYRAMVSLRNTTKRTMNLNVHASAGGQALAVKAVRLAEGEAREVFWQVKVPGKTDALQWEIAALDKQDGDKVMDRIRVTQKVQPKVPVTMQQAMFMRVEKPYSVATALPAGAIPGKGGIEVRLTARLSEQTNGVRSYFRDYPYTCLEQKVSMAVGLQDAKRWGEIVRNLSGSLDSQGLVQFFPGVGRGSEALTAYVLVMAHENGVKLSDEAEKRMQQALLDFVEGRIQPENWLWGERKYLDERRLSALEALAHTGVVNGRMLTAYQFKPIQMETITLIDWYSLLRRVPDAPDRVERLKKVERELRNRLTYVGGRLVFTTEARDYWWWLMVNGEVNALRLISNAMDDPAWSADMPALVRGAMLRQMHGHWATTVANAWGSVALKKFGDRFEHETVTGTTSASLEGGAKEQFDWSKPPVATYSEGGDPVQLQLPWPATTGEHPFHLSHQGGGQPWATIMLRAAVPGKAVESGYHISRSVYAVSQRVEGKWSRGDVARVRIDVDADESMSWVALSDPIPSGASILGNTARDSKIEQDDENRWDGTKNDAWPSLTERGLGFFRAYYYYVPKGHFWFEYTLRLNNPGEFSLPPTRIEAMYAPEIFGQYPNKEMKVLPP